MNNSMRTRQMLVCTKWMKAFMAWPQWSIEQGNVLQNCNPPNGQYSNKTGLVIMKNVALLMKVLYNKGSAINYKLSVVINKSRQKLTLCHISK